MKLIDFAKSRKQTRFEFSSTELKVSEGTGEKIAVLHLKTPIETVTGSQKVGQGADAQPLQAFDVDTVRISQRDMSDDGININEDGSGSVDTDLMLDVSNAGDVWLTSTSFRAFGIQSSRTRKEQKQFDGIKAMEERKAKALLKNVSISSTGEVKTDGKDSEIEVKGEKTPEPVAQKTEKQSVK